MKSLLLALVLLSSAADLDQRRKALADLLDAHWQQTMKRLPEYASMLGDKRYSDQVRDVSEEAALRDVAIEKKFLKQFQAIDTRGFSEQERLNRDLMIRELRESIDAARFRRWRMPVNQMQGPHLRLANFSSQLLFETPKDYEDYITRLSKTPKTLDGIMRNMRLGMDAKLMPPKFLLTKVAEQAETIAKTPAEKSPFARPLSKMPESFSDADKQRIRAAYLAAIETHVIPAYAKFAAFVRDEYAPRGRDTVGYWALPDGAERYAFEVRSQTTTNLTPNELHELGLREVARIETEMLKLAKTLGFDDLRKFNQSLESNASLRVKSGEQILDAYRHHTERMYAQLPRLFGRFPKSALVIEETPSFRAASAPGAEYNPGTRDGSRPGRIIVNTHEATSRKTISFEATAYHEGVPGHHMQVSIQQELPEAPPFRQEASYGAFMEGWALYSEQLGKEVGFYEDPYSDYGRLTDEMLRAIRLVVDTGLHSKRWTREQVVQYFRDHSAMDEVDIQSETDRYIVWPGQALAYKTGQLKILALRARAQQTLGARFDLRAFHDELLGAGALPLDTLEERMNRWIDSLSD